MVDDTLSYIKVAEYTVGFVFDSGSSLSAFSKILFYDEYGALISEFIPGVDKEVHIPYAKYFAVAVSEIETGPGAVTVSFENGCKISVNRIENEPEVALLLLGDTATVII